MNGVRVHFFIIYHTHKNRIKREAMRKAGEPTGNNRDIAIKAGMHLAVSLEKSLLWVWISNKKEK